MLGKDFVKQLIVTDVKKRLTPADALNNKWIQNKVWNNLQPEGIQELILNLINFTVVYYRNIVPSKYEACCNDDCHNSDNY